MKLFFIALALLAAAVLMYWVVVFFQKYHISMMLIRQAVAYQKPSTDYTETLLVLGDSTGVGVGASRPEDSVAGRLANALGATYVENRAVSGAVVTDVQSQFEKASRPTYNVILIQIGGNDITHFHSAKDSADALAPVVQEAVAHSKHVYLMSAGNVGAVTNFPPLMRPLYTNLTLQYHEEFAKMATREGAVYINLYQPPSTDPFTADPKKYLAADGFHPSSAGYELWFNRLADVLKSTQ